MGQTPRSKLSWQHHQLMHKLAARCDRAAVPIKSITSQTNDQLIASPQSGILSTHQDQMICCHSCLVLAAVDTLSLCFV